MIGGITSPNSFLLVAVWKLKVIKNEKNQLTIYKAFFYRLLVDYVLHLMSQTWYVIESPVMEPLVTECPVTPNNPAYQNKKKRQS